MISEPAATAKTAKPQTLLDAIQNGLSALEGRPDERILKNVKAFLWHKFTNALVKTDDPDEQNRLWALWAQITNNEGERS